MSRLIKSTQNPLVKLAVKLLKANHRAEFGLFLVYGWREIALALINGLTPKTIFLPDTNLDRIERPLHTILEHAPPTSVVYGSAEVMSKLRYGEMEDDPLGIFITPTWNLSRLPKSTAIPLVAILDQFEKPGNIGAVLRTADATGVTSVIATNLKCDIFNPNVIRASRGAIFTVPVAIASFSETCGWLKEQGIHCYATRVDAKQLYFNAEFRGPTAFVFGSESRGLSDSWNEAAADSIKLPMLGQADSLNVSNTAAVLFYEARRQRITA